MEEGDGDKEMLERVNDAIKTKERAKTQVLLRDIKSKLLGRSS